MSTEAINSLMQFKPQAQTKESYAKNNCENNKSIFEDSNNNSITNNISYKVYENNKNDTSKFNTTNSSTSLSELSEEESDFLKNAKTVFNGGKDKVIDQINSIVKFAKDEPVLAACIGGGIVGAGVLSTLFPPVGIAMGILCAGYGLYNLAKDIPEVKDAFEDLNNAKDESEKEKALYSLGYEGIDAVEDIAIIAGGTVQTATSAKSTIGCYELADYGPEAGIDIEEFIGNFASFDFTHGAQGIATVVSTIVSGLGLEEANAEVFNRMNSYR